MNSTFQVFKKKIHSIFRVFEFSSTLHTIDWFLLSKILILKLATPAEKTKSKRKIRACNGGTTSLQRIRKKTPKHTRKREFRRRNAIIHQMTRKNNT
jgi:hypothetical protein